MAVLAHGEVGKIDDSDMPGSMERLKNVARLTRAANDAATIPPALMAANKEKLPEPEAERKTFLAKSTPTRIMSSLVFSLPLLVV